VGTHSELLATNDHYRFVISSLEDEEKRERVDGEARLEEEEEVGA
jgi:ATP-binding cassette subfamily B protein